MKTKEPSLIKLICFCVFVLTPIVILATVSVVFLPVRKVIQKFRNWMFTWEVV
jgi:hypothetical protein